MSPSSSLLNPQAHNIFPFSSLPSLPPSSSLPTPSNLRYPQILKFPTKSCSLSSSSLSARTEPEEEDDELVIGDCVVFEEGIFEDPYLRSNTIHVNSSEGKPRSKAGKNVVEIEPEVLVPEQWKDAHEEINITKKEKRKIAQQLEFNSKVDRKRKGLVPLRNLNLKEYMALKESKLAQLKPLVLDTPSSFPVKEEPSVEKEGELNKGSSTERVAPKNPRWAVYGRGFEDVTVFFNSGNYDPTQKSSEGRQKLFAKEEKVLLNKRIPDLAAATSSKWLPLHTLAASGEFFLLDLLMRHDVDINAEDKNSLTALHKAIMGKKQAITNYLLRNSASPFVRDDEGATLMHYAVQIASSQAIKILLLYNVDINLPDKDGWTPLHLAVQSRRTDVVRLLLIKGADKTLKNKDGLTPLDLCLYSGQDTRAYELIKLLKQLPRHQFRKTEHR